MCLRLLTVKRGLRVRWYLRNTHCLKFLILDAKLLHSGWAYDACSFRDRWVTTRVYPRVFKLSSLRQCFCLLVFFISVCSLQTKPRWNKKRDGGGGTVLCEKPFPLPFSTPQIPNAVARDPSHAFLVLCLVTKLKVSNQMRIHYVIFWLTAHCSLLVGCQIVEEAVLCIFMVDVKMEAVYTSETTINNLKLKG
jgi:hypothetical protein